MTISMHRKDMQRKIDEELSTYEQRVLELKTRRNTYTNISVLPAELLVYIFVLVQDDSPLREWHHITHICRHWRDTAINAPILWTKPPTHDENYTDLMLERSKEASLDIFIDLSVSIGAIAAISNHTGRIETLNVSLTDDQLDLVWDRLGTSGHIFPLIKSIDIDRAAQPNAMNWKLPPVLMERSISIHSVHLRGITFDWEMISPLNLTSLCLEDVCITTQISSETLLHTLRQMPRLLHLVLHLTNLLSDDSPTTRVTKFALLLLRSLDISDHDQRHIPFFLSHFSLPKLNNFRMYSHTVSNDDGSSSSNALETVTTILSNGNFQVSGSLYIDRGYLRIFTPAETLVSITLPRVVNNRFTQQFLRQISPILPSLVQIGLFLPLNSNEFVEIFGNMHQLKAITVYADSALISALTGALTHRSGQGVPAFSSLDTIGCDAIGWDQIEPNALIAFCNALLQRANCATAIKTVYCFHNFPPQSAMDLLTNGGICIDDSYVPTAYGF